MLIGGDFMGGNAEILIVGGGVGGMTAALGLAQAGLPVELVEAQPNWNALGAGLTLNGGAYRALDQVGLAQAVIDAGFPSVGGTTICDSQGNILSAGSGDPMFGPGLPNMGGILRPKLHGVLREAMVAAAIPVRTGVALVDFQEAPDHVEAVMSDGSSRAYRYAIAADGLFSTARKLIFPDGPKPSFTGQGCWRAVVPRPEDVTATWVYSATGKKAGFNPISQDSMYLYLLESAPGNPWIEEKDWLPLLSERLSEFGGHLPRIVSQLDETCLINYRPLESVLLPRPWHKGHVLLIGDAAHATTPHVGYGAGMAIEDAVVLGEMMPNFSDAETLFRAFTERRYERCRAILEGSVAIGRLEMEGASVAAQRDLSARISSVIREPI